MHFKVRMMHLIQLFHLAGDCCSMSLKLRDVYHSSIWSPVSHSATSAETLLNINRDVQLLYTKPGILEITSMIRYAIRCKAQGQTLFSYWEENIHTVTNSFVFIQWCYCLYHSGSGSTTPLPENAVLAKIINYDFSGNGKLWISFSLNKIPDWWRSLLVSFSFTSLFWAISPVPQCFTQNGMLCCDFYHHHGGAAPLIWMLSLRFWQYLDWLFNPNAQWRGQPLNVGLVSSGSWLNKINFSLSCRWSRERR